MVGSLVVTAGLLIVLALAMQKGIGQEGILVASSGYWYAVPEATIGGNYMFPNLIAMGLTGSWIIVPMIGVGFILNSFQIVCNCYIGTTRIMVAQGLDGLLPDWFATRQPAVQDARQRAHRVLPRGAAGDLGIQQGRRLDEVDARGHLRERGGDGDLGARGGVPALPSEDRSTRRRRVPSTRSGASRPSPWSGCSGSSWAASWSPRSSSSRTWASPTRATRSRGHRARDGGPRADRVLRHEVRSSERGHQGRVRVPGDPARSRSGGG